MCFKSRFTIPAVAAILACANTHGQIINDDFESYAVGTFPSPPWLDVGLVNPDAPNPPDPSATVELTTDAFGDPTQVLELVEAIAQSQGIYQPIPLSSDYLVAADVRVDRFSNNSNHFSEDWAMEVGVGQLQGENDLAFVPQVGIYASSFAQNWRLYVAGTAGAFQDIDLGVGVELGTWYRVQVELEAATGVVRSRIWEIASGGLLVDQTVGTKGWTPEDGLFDIANLLDGELGGDVTISNLAVVDNVHIQLGLCPWDLDDSGSVGAADLLDLLFNWGPCPGCAADFDGDDIVGASDLLAMLFNWGPCP